MGLVGFPTSNPWSRRYPTSTGMRPSADGGSWEMSQWVREFEVCWMSAWVGRFRFKPESVRSIRSSTASTLGLRPRLRRSGEARRRSLVLTDFDFFKNQVMTLSLTEDGAEPGDWILGARFGRCPRRHPPTTR